jgi:hypothetical protein
MNYLRNGVLVAALVAGVGCGGASSSGGSGGGTGSTASGATGTGVTSQLPSAPANTPGTTEREIFNTEFQAAWTKILPGLKVMLDQEAQAMAGSVWGAGILDVEITNLTAQNSRMDPAPGMTHFANDRIKVRLPAQGTWDLILEGDIRITVSIGSWSTHYDIPVTIKAANLSAEIEAEFDHSDPLRPVLSRVGQPAIDFDVQIDTSASWLAQVTPILTPIADLFAKRALNNALNGLLPALQGMSGQLPGQIPGDGAPPLQDSGIAVPFEEIVTNIDAKARAHNQPHGMIFTVYMDTPQHDTWEDAYVNGGPGNVGNVVRCGSGGDAAIFTGQYLAAQAFRYYTTRTPEALSHAKWTLRGIERLLDVNGGTGLLARNAAPVGSLAHQTFQGREFNFNTIDGVPYAGYQGSIGISRDQYSGVFFGLSIAYELIDDQAVRARCATRIEQMLDYIIANDWAIDEDRVAVGQVGPGHHGASRGPVFWAGIPTQKITFLLMGHRFNPQKYAQLIADNGAVAEISWFTQWTSTFGTGHYYKFNLANLAYYNYFRLETDPVRWHEFDRAFRIMHRYTGHHRNAHFDLIAASIDPSLAPTLHPQTREVMRQFLRRRHREIAPPVVDLSNVTFVPVTMSDYSNGQGTVSFATTTVMMPSEPLDVELRRYTGHFQWQRSPFRPTTANAGNPREEKPGLDASLPYWMGRFYGCF